MVSGRVWGHRARARSSESRKDESSERPAAEVRPNDEPRPGDHVDRRRKLHRARQRPDRRERPQRRLLGRDGSVVHHGQPDADDRRRPPVRRRARRHRQPVGRDRRTERHRPRPRRELHVLVRALIQRRQQERASARRVGGRPVRRVLHRQRTADDRDRVVEQHVRAVDVDRPRAGRVPDRRLARPLDVLRRQRLARRRWRERPQRRLLGRDGSVVHDGQPDADDRRRPPVRRRARRHRQPVGRDRRTERHRPRPRRELPILVRHLVERGRQERTQRSSGWRSTRSTRTSPPTRAAHDRHHIVEQHVRAVDVDRPRAGRVPDRRLARPLDVLRRQRLTGWRSGARAVRARHRAARPRQPGRLSAPRTEGRDPRHRRHGTAGVGTEERVRASREVGRHASGGDRHHVRAQRPRDRLQPL